jgi:hypothetical protein
MTKQSNPIIHLSNTDTQAFKDQYFIQQEAKGKFEELIKGFIEPDKSKDSKYNQDYKSWQTCAETSRVHNTILINGKRGMGKTSFILSVLDQKAVWLNDVCNLCIIDPTMIETKEHIFLNIIVRIKEQVDKYWNNGNSVSEKCYQSWTDALKKLAGGLSVLDGVGSDQLDTDFWDSPELILEKGLDNTKHGWKLENHFHTFLEESLGLLGKKVFLLVLDDIDTSLKEGKAILEILRKYLTSKKLIIVMLGDIDLYATIVRQLQWEKMDPSGTLHKYEKDGSEVKGFYRSQIEHLEEQYLTKLLKPENRIKLKTILDLKETIDVLRIDGRTQSMSEFMRDLVESVFFHSRYSKLYEQTLLVQSTRSVVQVMKGWDENPNSGLEAFVDVLRQVFFTMLKKHLEPFDLLYTPKDRILLNLLAMYMLKEAISRDTHMKLLPEYRDDDKNITMLFLNAEINAQLKPQHYLSYFIKVGYAIDRFESLGDTKYIDKYIDHVGLDSDISNAHIARRLMATFKGAKGVFFGNLFLSKIDRGKIVNEKILAFFMSRVFSPKHGHYNYLSLFNLLGVLADISSLVDDSADEMTKQQLRKERSRVLDDCNLIRDFHVYDSESVTGWEFDSSEEQNDRSGSDITDDESAKYLNNLSVWSENVTKINQYLSAADLANIWIRLSYTLNGIDSETKNKYKNYAEMLDLYVAALLNAVYVCCEEKKGKRPDIKNPSTDPDYFYKKIEKYEACNEYTLFDYLFNCPALKRELIDSLEDLKSIILPIDDKTDNRKNSHLKNKAIKSNKDIIKDFRTYSPLKKIAVIASIEKWRSYSPSMLRKKLRVLGYYNIPSDNSVLMSLVAMAKNRS